MRCQTKHNRLAARDFYFHTVEELAFV